jgi:hypothetical protein
MRTILTLLCVFWAATATAQQVVRLAWDAPEGSNPDGYRLLYGPVPGAPTLSQEVGLRLDTELTLTEGTWYLTVVALEGGNVSPPSNEVSITIAGAPPPPPPPPPPPVDCAAVPLQIEVLRWPTNNGGKNLQYTSSYPVVTVTFISTKRTVTGMTFTDIRGCVTQVLR